MAQAGINGHDQLGTPRDIEGGHEPGLQNVEGFGFQQTPDPVDHRRVFRAAGYHHPEAVTLRQSVRDLRPPLGPPPIGRIASGMNEENPGVLRKPGAGKKTTPGRIAVDGKTRLRIRIACAHKRAQGQPAFRLVTRREIRRVVGGGKRPLGRPWERVRKPETPSVVVVADANGGAGATRNTHARRRKVQNKCEIGRSGQFRRANSRPAPAFPPPGRERDHPIHAGGAAHEIGNNGRSDKGQLCFRKTRLERAKKWRDNHRVADANAMNNQEAGGRLDVREGGTPPRFPESGGSSPQCAPERRLHHTGAEKIPLPATHQMDVGWRSHGIDPESGDGYR